MTSRASVLYWAATVAFFGGTAAARAAEYKIDKEHSAILFKIKNRDISYVFGRFKDVSGMIITDRLRDPRQYQFDLKIKARSIDSNSRKRDRRLKGTKFFASAKHPMITFTSSKSTKLEDDKFEITGEIELLGVKKELTFVFVKTGFKEMGESKYRLGVETEFTLKRSDFGMVYMIPEIADEVTVIVNLEAECTIVPSG